LLVAIAALLDEEREGGLANTAERSEALQRRLVKQEKDAT
jgi:hypothetical protein